MIKVAACIITNNNNEILLLKRSPDRKYFPNKWCFVTGTIESNENPKQCAFREIKEELGYIEFELIKKGIPFEDNISGTETYDIYPFLFRLISGEINIDKEHTKYVWIKKNDIHNYDIISGLIEDLKALDL